MDFQKLFYTIKEKIENLHSLNSFSKAPLPERWDLPECDPSFPKFLLIGLGLSFPFPAPKESRPESESCGTKIHFPLQKNEGNPPLLPGKSDKSPVQSSPPVEDIEPWDWQSFESHVLPLKATSPGKFSHNPAERYSDRLSFCAKDFPPCSGKCCNGKPSYEG